MENEILCDILRRDEEVWYMHPSCPKCPEYMQIQVIDKRAPALWKCRICKVEFVFEENSETKEIEFFI